MQKRYVSTYTVFDVETPNRKNDSVCSIGIVRVEGDKVILAKEFLIDPEDSFDYFNVNIHGINRSMVRGKPTFRELWPEISLYFQNSILIAHNASFDLNVLSKCIAGCGHEVPELFSLCTMKLSKRYLSELGSHRLNSICDYFNVALKNHHNALDDAIACHGIFACLKERHEITMEDVSLFRMGSKSPVGKIDRGKTEKSMNELSGLISGFAADGIIDDLEIVRLNHWIGQYRKYRKSAPFDQVLPILEGVLSDGIVSKDELSRLLRLSAEIEGTAGLCKDTSQMQILKGMIEGILVSGELTAEKVHYLKDFLEKNGRPKGTQSEHAIQAEIRRILNDDRGSLKGFEGLQRILTEFIDPVNSLGIDCISFSGKSVCLTGNFTRGSKDDIVSLLQDCGAEVCNTVTRKTQILIVGGEGSRDWSFGNYGTKVKKAMEMKAKGADIVIVTEEEMFNYLQEKALSL